MKGQTVCGRCGKRTEDPAQGIEVEFKDFRVSELLEIRTKDHRPPSEKSDPEKTGEQDAPDTPSGTGTMGHEETEAVGESAEYRPGVHEGRRSSTFLFALVLFLLALLAGIVLLWNLFTR
jgi:hypothetical protein